MKFRRNGPTEHDLEEREAARAKRRSFVGCDFAEWWIRAAFYRILLDQGTQLDYWALFFADDVALSMLGATDRVLKQHRRELVKERGKFAAAIALEA